MQQEMMLLQRDTRFFTIVHKEQLDSMKQKLLGIKSSESPVLSQTEKILSNPKVQEAFDEMVRMHVCLDDACKVFMDYWEEFERDEDYNVDTNEMRMR